MLLLSFSSNHHYLSLSLQDCTMISIPFFFRVVVVGRKPVPRSILPTFRWWSAWRDRVEPREKRRNLVSSIPFVSENQKPSGKEPLGLVRRRIVAFSAQFVRRPPRSERELTAPLLLSLSGRQWRLDCSRTLFYTSSLSTSTITA